MDKLRLRFEKTGRAIYISHLDLMHTMQRAFSRAGYELKYSEGFNPHPQISIALPLSVGTESKCEILDFRLNEDADIEQLPARLTAAMPEGIRVTECYAPERKVAELKYLSVEGRLEYDGRDTDSVTKRLTEFFNASEIIITKKTKRGMGEVDIKPSIKDLRFSAFDGYVKVSAILSAQEPTLNPEQLISALKQLEPTLVPDYTRFMRIETYDSDMRIYR